MPKQIFVKPSLRMLDRARRVLLSRIFEREKQGAMQVGKYMGNEPILEESVRREMSMQELGQKEFGLEDKAPLYEYDFQPDKVKRWRVPDEDRPPRERIVQDKVEEGHLRGGTLPMQQTGALGRYSVKDDSLMNIMNPTGLEYEPGQTRRYFQGMRQSEDLAKSVAELRGGQAPRYFNPMEETLPIKAGPGSSKERIWKQTNKRDLAQKNMKEEYEEALTPQEKFLSKSDKIEKEKAPIRSTLVNPRAVLSKAQMAAVEKGAYEPTAAEMMSFKPAETRKMARLMRRTEHGDLPVNLPWAKAADKLHKFPDVYYESRKSMPPADVLSMRPYGNVKGRDVGGVTYERQLFRPVTEEVERAKKFSETYVKEKASEVRKKERAEAAVGRVGQYASQGKIGQKIRQEVDPDKLHKEALLIQKLWKRVGGLRTLTGRAWQEYLEAEKKKSGAKKYKTAYDYFESISLKYLHEPEATTKRYQQEVVSLKRIIADAEEEHGPLFD